MLNQAIKSKKNNITNLTKTTNKQCAITTTNLCHFIAGGCSLYYYSYMYSQAYFAKYGAHFK